jgi:hypothetical protein
MWAGSWGAIQGAKMAEKAKITTRATPIAARGLRRAMRVPLLASCQLPDASCVVVDILVRDAGAMFLLRFRVPPHPLIFQSIQSKWFTETLPAKYSIIKTYM